MLNKYYKVGLLPKGFTPIIICIPFFVLEGLLIWISYKISVSS